MADEHPRCVIASSNRYNDIKPYCSYLFKNYPQVWGSVFPWEFPQHASREVEEDFLRRFFDASTIYMQGGAGTPEIPGNGFRFLKQIWYSCALWNLEHRVPAVEKWYLAQPDTIELLNDPNIRDFFLRNDVEPGTFFKPVELKMYGDKFLRVVIIGIQKNVREKYEMKETEQQTKDDLSVTIPVERILTTTSDQTLIKSAPPAQSEHGRTTHPDQADFSSRRATLSSRDKPEHVPVPLLTEPAVSEATDILRTTATVTVPPNVDIPPYPCKRVNSTNKHFNNRGGHYSTRQSHQFTDRDHASHPFSPTFYNPQMANAHHHGPPGPSMEYMRNMSQGQPTIPMSNHLQYVPGQYGQPGMMQPHGLQQQHAFPSHQQQPIYFNHNAFPHPDKHQFKERNFEGSFRSFSNDDANAARGGHRRTSQGQGSRGGKPKGANSLRGRGRGRDSFNSTEERPVFPPGIGHGPRYSNDHGGLSFDPNYKGRRSSVYQEKNWRSNTDHPQERIAVPHMKENLDPGRSFRDSDHKFALIGPPQHRGEFNATYESKPGMMRSFQFEHADSSNPERVPRIDNVPSANATSAQSDDFTCDRDRIGAGCTAVKKLVVFNVPLSLATKEMKDMFSSCASVRDVSRGPPPKMHSPFDPLVWINFDSHNLARDFLKAKPSTWLDGRSFRCEVPKEYWDPQWTHHKGPVERVTKILEHSIAPLQNARGPPVPTVALRVEESIPSILAAPDQKGNNAEGDESANTTPTPSGANTPKRNNKKSRKNKKQLEDLRKTSLTASVELKQSADRVDETSDANSTVPIVARGHDGKVDQPAETSIESNAEFEEVQKQRSDSVQTEVQSAQDPPFAPTEGVQTRLPQTAALAMDSTDRLTTVPETQSTDSIAALPEPQVENFREDQAKESQTEAKDVEHDTVKQLLADTSPLAAATETLSKADESLVDDSFHTASGSPDSIRYDGARIDVNKEDSDSSPGEQKVSEDLTSEPGSPPVLEPASPTLTDETISPKTVKKAAIPDVSARPKVTISITEPDSKDAEYQIEQRSSSGSTIVPQTPAFVTAPNTPAVGHESTVEEHSTDTEISVASPAEQKADKNNKIDKDKAEKVEKDRFDKAEKEKIERAKGPAQTQSFSLYGKKNEKKDKKGKKATLKGKPASRAASQSSTRTLSRATTPSVDPAGEGQKTRCESKQDHGQIVRQDSKVSTTGLEQKCTRGPINPNQDDTPVTQHESPSKRGKLSNLLSGIFGGGQQSQPSSNKSRTSSTPSAKNWLTKSKAPDRPLDTEPPLVDHRTNVGSDMDRVEYAVAPKETKTATSTVSGAESTLPRVNDSFTIDILAGGITEHDSKPALGLGISNTTTNQSVQSGTGPKKKARPKTRKSDSAGDRDQLQINTDFSPEVGRKHVSDIFRFGDGSSPQVKNNRDDRSDTSSQTMGVDASSSNLPSPHSARKLLPRPPGSGHLMETKKPAWRKMKQRVLSRSTQDATANDATDEGVMTVTGSSDDSEQDFQTDGTIQHLSDSAGPQTIIMYQYIGAPLRDDIDEEEPEVELSKEKLQRLAAEEIRRKRRGA